MRFPFDTLFKSCPHAGPEFTNANKARRSRSLGGHLHRRRVEEDAPRPGVVLVGRDLQEQLHFRSLLSEAMRFWLVVVAILGVVTLVFVRRRVLKRIDAMSATGRRIMSGDLSERLPVDGSGDEFDRLAVGFNLMLDRIEALLHGLKDVSDNIAHDLKTPLTRMRNRVEEALRAAPDDPVATEALSRTLEDCDGLIRTFDALLRIARLEAGASDASLEEVDLAMLVGEVAELYEPVVEDAGGTLTSSCEPGLMARVNRELVVQALINLVENALKYGVEDAGGPEGGPGATRLELEARAEGGTVVLCVRDHGPGIPDADKDRATRRFVRLEESRNAPGSGLGLSLVQAVARLHDGRLALRDAEAKLAERESNLRDELEKQHVIPHLLANGFEVLPTHAISRAAWFGHTHAAPTPSGATDCTHFCMPGIPDIWAAILLGKLSGSA